MRALGVESRESTPIGVNEHHDDKQDKRDEERTNAERKEHNTRYHQN
jgi:hypothetical protein